jgi:hypothetical protein
MALRAANNQQSVIYDVSILDSVECKAEQPRADAADPRSRGRPWPAAGSGPAALNRKGVEGSGSETRN